MSIMYLILDTIDADAIQFVVETLIYHVLVFYYLLVLSLVLLSLVDLLLVQTLVLPSPVAHPQRRQQVPSLLLLQVVSSERLPVQRPEHVLLRRDKLLPRTVRMVRESVRQALLDLVDSDFRPGIVYLHDSGPLKVKFLGGKMGT